MLVHRIVQSSRANGPGNRFAVWTQGCSRGCPGCFNPETHAVPGKGRWIDESDLLDMVPLDSDGITVSGGEPFDQAESLCVLLGLAAAQGFHVMVYTGYTWDELRLRADSLGDRWIHRSLELIDVLVEGPYRFDYPPRHPWAGSGNQRVLHLSGGRIVEELDGGSFMNGIGEIVIDRAGTITATGIFDGLALQKETKQHAQA